MSIECNNTTPIASKASASLTLTSDDLNNILDVATLVDLSNPLDSLNRASVMNITNALANITQQTDLSEYPTLNARLESGTPTYTEIADFLLSTNTNIADIEETIVDYNTGLLGGSSTVLTNSPNISVTTAGVTNSLDTGNNIINDSGISTADSSNTSSSTPSGGATGDGLSSASANSASNISNNESTSSSNVASNFDTGSGNSTVIGSDGFSDFGPGFGSQVTTDTSGLTQIERAALLTGGVTALVPALITRLFNDLDFYYDVNIGGTISSGLCKQFNSTLGDLSKAMLIVNAGKNVVTDIINVTEKDAKKLADAIKQQGLLRTLLDLLKSIVDKLIAKVKQLMNAAVTAGTSAVESLGSAAKSIQKKISRMARDIEEFTSDTNLADIKKAVEAFIAKAASSFERLTPENIALLMFRLCQFTESLQAVMMAPAIKMNKMANQVESELKALTSVQKTNVKEAVKYGAIRVSEEDKKAKKDSVIKLSKNIKPSERNVNYVTSQEPTKEEIALVSSISESGLGQNITFSSSVISDQGWQDIDASVWYKLLRIQEQTGSSYVVKQAATKRKNSASALGGTSKTAHDSGYAIDINVSSDIRDDTIVAASRAGFTGIGVYESHLHLDNGNRRAWQSNATDTVEDFETSILFDIHNIDGFRKKRSI